MKTLLNNLNVNKFNNVSYNYDSISTCTLEPEHANSSRDFGYAIPSESVKFKLKF